MRQYYYCQFDFVYFKHGDTYVRLESNGHYYESRNIAIDGNLKLEPINEIWNIVLSDVIYYHDEFYSILHRSYDIEIVIREKRIDPVTYRPNIFIYINNDGIGFESIATGNTTYIDYTTYTCERMRQCFDKHLSEYEFYSELDECDVEDDY